MAYITIIYYDTTIMFGLCTKDTYTVLVKSLDTQLMIQGFFLSFTILYKTMKKHMESGNNQKKYYK
jgi:hypothetical protein